MENLREPFLVYVVSLDDSVPNYTGTLFSFDLKKNICELENDDGDMVSLSLDQLQDINTGRYEDVIAKIKEDVRLSWVVKVMSSIGLSEGESELFYSLVKKIRPDDESVEMFFTEWEKDIPFDGGLTFKESIVALCYAFDKSKIKMTWNIPTKS